MRYVEGENLATVIEAEGRLPLRRVLHLITQVAAALDAAHAAGLVHRDVTPANIFLTPNDHVYLMDFGLTKRRLKDADETQTGHLMGTPNYVAPERIRGGEVDHRTDIYALGCVTFHAITGRVPFPMEEQEAKLWAHMSEPPPLVSSVAPDVPSAIDEVVGRAMAKEPSNRFGSAGEMAQALAVAVDPDVSVHAERPATGWRGSRIAAAMIAPFSLAILASTVIAAAILDLLPLGALAAIVAYAAAVVVALREDDRASGPAVDAEATRVETENE
jgi:serine/threonine-protein kinase